MIDETVGGKPDDQASQPKLAAIAKPMGVFDFEPEDKLQDEDLGMVMANKVRVAVINSLTKNGTSMPEDTEQLNVLLKAAKDIDTQSLGRKRVKVEEKNAATDASVRQQVLDLFSSKAELVQAIKEGQLPKVAYSEPEILDEKNYEFVEGETQVGGVSETYEEFMTRMTQQDKKALGE